MDRFKLPHSEYSEWLFYCYSLCFLTDLRTTIEGERRYYQVHSAICHLEINMLLSGSNTFSLIGNFNANLQTIGMQNIGTNLNQLI